MFACAAEALMTSESGFGLRNFGVVCFRALEVFRAIMEQPFSIGLICAASRQEERRVGKHGPTGHMIRHDGEKWDTHPVGIG